MTKQTFKKHQFIICTFFVFIGLITIYSPSHGGTYTGGPAGGICRDREESDTILDSTVTDGKAAIGFRTDNEDDEVEGDYYYQIITFEHSIHISLNFISRVSYTDVNGETHLLGSEEDTEDGEVHEYLISGLQPDTEYRIGISGIMCGYTIVETEPSPESEEFPPSPESGELPSDPKSEEFLPDPA